MMIKTNLMTTTVAIAVVSARAVEDMNAGNEAFGPDSGEPPALDECGSRAARPTASTANRLRQKICA